MPTLTASSLTQKVSQPTRLPHPPTGVPQCLTSTCCGSHAGRGGIGSRQDWGWGGLLPSGRDNCRLKNPAPYGLSPRALPSPEHKESSQNGEPLAPQKPQVGGHLTIGGREERSFQALVGLEAATGLGTGSRRIPHGSPCLGGIPPVASRCLGSPYVLWHPLPPHS